MIPHRIQLKNFLSYGPRIQEINFDNHHLICLAGKNGHGKSALLDAITWALWGTARKISSTPKADAHLLHLGQTHMMVLFDFECGGSVYRIRREYSNSHGKPYAALEFGILDPESDNIKPLSDKTIRATQERIIEHIGIDYEAFINTSFLRQGQSNEFSKKSPKDRKEILASILGLNHFEALKSAALQKAKAGVQQLSLSHQLIESLNQELEQRTQTLSSLERAQHDLARLEHAQKELSIAIGAHQAKRELFMQEHQQFKFAQSQHVKMVAHRTSLHQELLSIYKEWQATQRQLAALPDPAQLNQKKEKATVTLEVHNKKFLTLLELRTQKLTFEGEFQKCYYSKEAAYEQSLMQDRIVLSGFDAQIQASCVALEELSGQQKHIQEKQTAAKQKLAVLEKNNQKNGLGTQVYNASRLLFEKRKQYYHLWTARHLAASQELENIASKNALTHDENNPSCPLCEQNLSASRKRVLKAKFAADSQRLTRKIQKLAQALNKLKITLKEQHAELEKAKKEQELLATHAMDASLAQNVINELELVEKELSAKYTQINERRTSIMAQAQTVRIALEKAQAAKSEFLAQDPDLSKLKEQQRELETKIEAVDYNKSEHEAAQKALTEIQALITSAHARSQTLILQQNRKDQIFGYLTQLRTLKKDLAALEATMPQEHILSARHQELEAAQIEFEKETKMLADQRESLCEQKGRLEEQKRKQEDYLKQIEVHKKTITQLQENIDDYHTLCQALGKDGIQALLIENALPEIENEANLLLSQLTDNQTHIIIESLKDLKKGGTKETLDILISDPMGIRPYEMFSGGEAFRIDFALRVAISKLLARRAGTSLQTLIIDEGFGSQDDDGLSRLMDALYRIQDNFKKIIIVSHLGWLKDQFPVHFHISKGPQGSTVSVIQQG